MEKILATKMIRMSRYDLLNDPKESKATYTYGGLPSKEIYDLELIAEFSKRIRTYTKLLCFSKDIRVRQKYDTNNPYNGKGFNHPRMWAQYGDGNRGICLVFDRQSLINEIGKIENTKPLCDKISYSTKYLDDLAFYETPYNIDMNELLAKGNEKYYQHHMRQNKRVYFFSKHTDWKDEAEYRIVLLGSSSNDILLKVNSSLKAIIVGSEFPEVYLPSLGNICKNMSIDAYRVNWEKGFIKYLTYEFDL